MTGTGWRQHWQWQEQDEENIHNDKHGMTTTFTTVHWLDVKKVNLPDFSSVPVWLIKDICLSCWCPTYCYTGTGKCLKKVKYSPLEVHIMSCEFLCKSKAFSSSFFPLSTIQYKVFVCICMLTCVCVCSASHSSYSLWYITMLETESCVAEGYLSTSVRLIHFICSHKSSLVLCALVDDFF